MLHDGEDENQSVSTKGNCSKKVQRTRLQLVMFVHGSHCYRVCKIIHPESPEQVGDLGHKECHETR